MLVSCSVESRGRFGNYYGEKCERQNSKMRGLGRKKKESTVRKIWDSKVMKNILVGTWTYTNK